MKTRSSKPSSDETLAAVPASLRVFGWNLGTRIGPEGRRQLALNVIERGRAWHWRQLPKGWFDLGYCLEHGQQRTRAALRRLFNVS